MIELTLPPAVVADTLLRKLSDGAAWRLDELASPVTPRHQLFAQAIDLLTTAGLVRRVRRTSVMLASNEECSEALLRSAFDNIPQGWVGPIGRGACFSELVCDARSARKVARARAALRFDTLSCRLFGAAGLCASLVGKIGPELMPVASSWELSADQEKSAEWLAVSGKAHKFSLRGRTLYLFPNMEGSNRIPPELVVCALLESGRPYSQYWVNCLYEAMGFSAKPARTSYAELISAGLIQESDRTLTNFGRLAGQTVLRANPAAVELATAKLQVRLDRRARTARENGKKAAALRRGSTKS